MYSNWYGQHFRIRELLLKYKSYNSNSKLWSKSILTKNPNLYFCLGERGAGVMGREGGFNTPAPSKKYVFTHFCSHALYKISSSNGSLVLTQTKGVMDSLEA